ncbi:MAG: aminopeptidase P family protein [Candidatus Helarchaeota archaeon]|nr:aminopeptidase P family protein [Candidatus Helarchaeota archaeon]
MQLTRRDETVRPKPIGYDKKRAAELMEEYNFDILIITSPANVFYASGLPVRHQAMNPILFALENQYPTIALIYRDGEESLIVWEIYDKKLSWIKNAKGCLTPKDALRGLKTFLKKNIGEGRIGVESTFPFYIHEFITKKFPQVKINNADDLLLDMQLIKTEEEIRRITESTRIAEKALLNMIEAIKPGITDIELIKIAKRTVIDEGAEGWDHFTMSIGDSDPEAPGIGLKVQQNQVLRLDVGAMYQGYVSDVNRMAYLGEIPSDLNNAINAIIQVQNACQKAIKPGADPKEILSLAEKTWRDAGRQDQFIIIAHSLGLKTEEYHFFDPMRGGLKRKFEEGNVLNMEAWTLLKGYGTIGNEDQYIVTKSGCERISTLEMKIFKR